MSGPGFAFLSRGRLHVGAGGARTRVLESRFGQAVVDRSLQIEQRHAWKAQGRGARFMTGGLLWGGAGEDPSAAVAVALTSLSPGCREGELLYSLETREIAGVLALRPESGEEQRLFHGNERRVKGLAASREHSLIACSVPHQGGAAFLGVMQADGSDLAEVTEGDVVDAAPSWVPGSGRRLVYHSAGLGRTREGHVQGRSPFAIRRLDLDRGEVETLAEDARHDLLTPRVTANGDLLYIRCPHAGPPRATFLAATRDFLMFPVRLLHAVFQWLNFFTARYSGRPLTTAGGPRKEGADLRQMMVWGNLIDAEQAARESAARGDDTPDLVPSTWQLVRQSPGGKTDVVAKGVLSFDVAPDGSVIYTNGSAVYWLAPGTSRQRLCVEPQIEQVVLL